MVRIDNLKTKSDCHLSKVSADKIIKYSFDGETLAVGYGNGALRLFNATTGELLKDLRKTRYGGFQIMCLRFHPKEHHILLAGTSEGLIFLCNTQDGTVTEKITEKNNEINCLDFDCEGFNFATAGKDLNVRIYDTKTFQLDKTYGGYDSTQNPTEIASCAMRVFSLKYHPDKPNIFVTGGWENHLKEWSVLTGSWVGQSALQEWDWTSGKSKDIPFDFKGHNGAYLYCAQYCDNDVVMAGGSGTNSVQATKQSHRRVEGMSKESSSSESDKFRIKIGEVQMKSAVHALDTTMGGRLFAVGGKEDNLVLGRLC
ncbi:unnamed protein product [Mytilus edulis]|uniref:Anaphase-promoting complex subunit 4-like WD40 domain-containing protein n=1 Tax=Mytilus edulis TaxID=6550 RepID=A0A8S3QF84_MYTED|nr:unnamed protein product [Mytilus edulis]